MSNIILFNDGSDFSYYIEKNQLPLHCSIRNLIGSGLPKIVMMALLNKPNLKIAWFSTQIMERHAEARLSEVCKNYIVTTKPDAFKADVVVIESATWIGLKNIARIRELNPTTPIVEIQ